MQYNEPRSTPWWPGGDFGVVASSALLPPPCIHSVLLTWHTSIPNLFCVDELSTVSGTVRRQMMEKTLQIQTRKAVWSSMLPSEFLFPRAGHRHLQFESKLTYKWVFLSRGGGAEYLYIWLYKKARPSPGLSNNLQKKSRCTLPPHVWKQYTHDKHNQMVKYRDSLILLNKDQWNKQFMKSHRVCLPVTKETTVGSERFEYCSIFIWGGYSEIIIQYLTSLQPHFLFCSRLKEWLCGSMIYWTL